MTRKGWLYRRRLTRSANARTARWRELEKMGYGGVIHGAPVRADSASPLREGATNGRNDNGIGLGDTADKLIVLLSPLLLSFAAVYMLIAGSPVVSGKWSLVHLTIGLLAGGGICGAGFRFYYRAGYTSYHYGAMGAGILLLAASVVGVTVQDTIGTRVVLNNSELSEHKQTLDAAQRDLDILKGNQTLVRLTRGEINALGGYDRIRSLYIAAEIQSQELSDRWNVNQGVSVTAGVDALLYTYLRDAGLKQAATLQKYFTNYDTPEPALEESMVQPVADLEVLLGDGENSIQRLLYETKASLLP